MSFMYSTGVGHPRLVQTFSSLSWRSLSLASLLQPCSWDQAVLFLESFLLVSQRCYTSSEEVPQGSWSHSFCQFMAQFPLALARNASWDADKGTLLIQIPASSLYGCARCDHVYNLRIIYVYAVSTYRGVAWGHRICLNFLVKPQLATAV